MANIINYINKYGNLTFDELSFNEVDNAIFSSLSYLDFDGILDVNDHLTLNKAAELFFKRYDKKELAKNIISIQHAIKIFNCIKEERRFKDLVLYNYVYKCDNEKQFSALFIDFRKDYTYVSFEGTDDLVSGWYEDAALSYMFPVPAHEEAIKYINSKISILSKKNYILGGHSKGGNLALVAGMYANRFIQKKIVAIISNDGPGLRMEELNSKRYKRIEEKFQLIIPDTSIVGMLLNHNVKPDVINANKKGLMAHSLLSWEVIDNHFVRQELSKFSIKLDKILTDWLNTYSDEEKREFVLNIFDIFERCKIVSLLDIKSSMIPSIISLVRESSKLDKKSKKIIMDLINLSIDK